MISWKKYVFLLPMVVAVLFVVIWFSSLLPRLSLYTKDFAFTADINSVDTFFDEKQQKFLPEKTSNTIFTYHVTSTTPEALIIENTFEVKTLQGEKIVSITRNLAIHPLDGSHVSTLGDKSRVGYLFAPKNLHKQQVFPYWHINYNVPATMTFVSEERLYGLLTYKFESDYAGQVVDQTENLTHLPGVGETKGIRLSPKLQVWFEPVSGRMVKYSDETLANYYDLKSNQVLFPWNKFKNVVTEESVQRLVASATAAKFTIYMQQAIFPVIVLFTGVLFSILTYMHSNKFVVSIFVRRYIIVCIALLSILYVFSVIAGWVFEIEYLKSGVLGFATMKFTTAVLFLFSNIIGILLAYYFEKKNELAQLLLPIFVLILGLVITSAFVSSVFGIKTGIENLFFIEDSGSILTVNPGRPSHGTLLAFVTVIIIGVLTMIRSNVVKNALLIGSAIEIFLGVTSVIGYLLQVQYLYFYFKDLSSAMAINTAVLLVLLGVEFLLIASLIKDTESTV